MANDGGSFLDKVKQPLQDFLYGFGKKGRQQDSQSVHHTAAGSSSFGEMNRQPDVRSAHQQGGRYGADYSGTDGQQNLQSGNSARPAYQAEQPVFNQNTFGAGNASSYQQHLRRSKMGEAQSMNPAAQQSPAQQPEQPAAPNGTICVINVRSIGECHAAIEFLRRNQAVIVVMDTIREAGEMQRLVDVLSGACFSLNAAILRVSRLGVYILTTPGFQLLTDSLTQQMNGNFRSLQTQNNYQTAAQQPAYQQTAQQSAYQQPQQNPSVYGAGNMATVEPDVSRNNTSMSAARPAPAVMPEVSRYEQQPGYVNENRNA